MMVASRARKPQSIAMIGVRPARILLADALVISTLEFDRDADCEHRYPSVSGR